MPLVSHNCPSCAAPLAGSGPVLVCRHCGNEFRLADKPAAPVTATPLRATGRAQSQPFKRLRKLSLASKLAICGGLVVALAAGFLFLRALAGGRVSEYRVINDAALSPDGKRLASVHGQGFSVKGTLRIWDVATGVMLERLDGIDTPMWVVKWSPDGKMLATGGHGGSIQLWDTTTWQPLNHLEGAVGFVRELEWSPDSRRVATGDSRGFLRVWDATDGRAVVNSLLHSKDIAAIAWSPDGKSIATGGWDNAAIIFDLASGKPLYKFGDKSYVTSLAWSPDSRRLAAGGLSNLVTIIDATNGVQLQSLAGHKNSITGLAWSPDGKSLASTDNGYTVHLWDAATGLPVQVFENEGYYASIAWSPDGKLLASGGKGVVRVWEASSGQLHKLTGHARETDIDIIAWSADGAQLFTRGRYDATLRVWDVGGQKELHTMTVTLSEALQKTLF